MTALILKLDLAGQPVRWVTRREGALLVCRGQVAYPVSDNVITLYGGYGRDGTRSSVDVHTILAVRSIHPGAHDDAVPCLTNRGLFRRDNHTCMYCGEKMSGRWLTRDHIRPISRGGADRWENVVAACQVCNQRKDDKLPEEAGMKLLALPYVPNSAEGLILANRNILADQMDYLRGRLGKDSRLAA